MPAHLSWVDFCEDHRSRMLNEILSLFTDHGTLDVLGLGPIRDAFAERFFPGTSTIYTRAKYMLFIPWIYQDIERNHTKSAYVAEEARRKEVDLIGALLKSGDTDGLMGKRVKGELRRFPSSIYWAGLGTWGIRLFPGSQSQYHRYLDRFYELKEHEERAGDGGLVYSNVRPNWDPSIPRCPSGFPKGAHFSLTLAEARYLRDRIKLSHSESLMRVFLDYGRPVKSEFVWQQPSVEYAPSDLQSDVEYAMNFSETMWGASVLYNLMLAELRGDDQDGFRSDLNDWARGIHARRKELSAWAQSLWHTGMLSDTKIPKHVRQFVTDWLQLMCARNPLRMADDELARALVHKRERDLKGARARLDNRRAHDERSGVFGYSPMDFRWRIAYELLIDIFDGLGEKGIGHA